MSLSLVGCMESLHEDVCNGCSGLEATLPVTFSVEGVVTRSSIGPEGSLDSFDSKISNITIFMFEKVDNLFRLHNSYFYDLSSDKQVTLKGVNGRQYHIYAIANCGDMSSVITLGDTESSLSEIVITSHLSDITLDTGMPLSCGPINITINGGNTITIQLERLMARFDLRLIQNFRHGNFKLKSLKLCQSPTVTNPFYHSNAFTTGQANKLTFGDYATNTNIAALMNGSLVRFYTLENACGVLLDNPTKDPSLKVPSEGTSLGGYLPTYIEVVGTYTDKSGGLICENTYRMFLGENAYDNFNVIRGRQYTLTFTLSDTSGFLENYWKMESMVSDSRNFRFKQRYYTVESSSSQYVSTLNTLAEYGITYQLSESLTGVTFNPKTMTLSQGVVHSERSGTLSAYYWDGRLADKCTVIAQAYVMKEKPIGIEQVEAVWQAQYFTKKHDPNCSISHGQHYENCPNAAFHMHPNHPDYIDPRDCPYYHSGVEHCENQILVPSGGGIAGLRFVIATNYRVDATGKLVYDVLTPNLDYDIISAEMLSIDGRDFGNDIHYADHEWTGNKVYVEAQFQAEERTHWHIMIRPKHRDLDSDIRHYIVSNAGDKQTIYPEIKMTYPSKCSSINTFRFGCNDPQERIWLVSANDILKFENRNDRTKLNSFVAGNEIGATLCKKGKITPVYALNKNGAVVNMNNYNTNGVCPHILECYYQSSRYDKWPFLKYGFYTGFFGCYLPISIDDRDMTLYAYDGPTEYIIDTESLYYTVASDGYFLTADYQGQEHMTSWTMDMSYIRIAGKSYSFSVNDDATWKLSER